MKKLTTLFVLFFLSLSSVFAQDTIKLTNGYKIIVNIVESGDKYVKYRKTEKTDGRIYKQQKEFIFVILYANGAVDSVFQKLNPNYVDKPIVTNEESQTVAKKEENNVVQQKTTVINKKKPENEYIGTFRIKPFTSILSAAFLNSLQLPFVITVYPHSKIGIPIDLDFAYNRNNGNFGFSLMSGIEAVPITHREKSGLYLNAEVGFFTYLPSHRYNDNIFFCATSNIGYQLVKGSFVFIPAIGFKYAAIDGNAFTLNLMLDIGFPFKKKKRL
ncbi:MAG: hypothetical protein LBN95_12025 [Prevotellaceae bacterium]|jgi:hypothetical protein|nr:hypothetical protein [Prevotellaceae bacterium]